MITKSNLRSFFSVFLVLFINGLAIAQDPVIKSYPNDELAFSGQIKIFRGKVWCTYGTGAVAFDGVSYQQFDRSSGLDVDSVYDLEADVAGRLWFTGVSGTAFLYNGKFKQYDRDYHSWSGDILLERTGDTFWWETWTSGNDLQKITASDTVHYTTSRFSNIEQDPLGGYWALGSDGLYKLTGGNWLAVTDTAFNSYNEYSMHIDKSGDIWISDGSDLIRRRAGSAKFETVHLSGGEELGVSSITSDQDGTVYFGTWANGVIVKHGESWSVVDTSNGLINNNVRDLEVDSLGNVWLLQAQWRLPEGSEGGLSVMLKQEWQHEEPATGIVYADRNGNGIRDSDELGIPNQFIKLMPSGGYIITDPQGNFSFLPAQGQNTLTAQPTGFWKKGVTPLSYTFTYTEGDAPVHFEIGFAWNEVRDVDVYTSTNAARPGFNTVQFVDTYNRGSLPARGKVTFEYDKRLVVTGYIPVPDLIEDNRITWDYETLESFNGTHAAVSFITPVNIPLGTVLTGVAYLDPTLNLDNIGSSSDTVRVTVTGSYDPNDKQVDQGRGVARYTLMNTPLTYRIRFQNTGTDTAFVVKIKDKLDPNLEITSLKIESSSHPMTYSLNDGELTFTFDNIKLPDSVRNEPASHGFVRYSISPKAGFAENTVVRNQADIYFDFNTAVATNEVFNTFVTKYPENDPDDGKPVSIEPGLNSMAVYPNPSADGTIQIVLPDAASIRSGELISASGNRLMQFSDVPESGRIVVDNIPPGLYLLRLQQGTSVTVTKVVVTR